jgi:hypothetical protein
LPASFLSNLANPAKRECKAGLAGNTCHLIVRVQGFIEQPRMPETGRATLQRA